MFPVNNLWWDGSKKYGVGGVFGNSWCIIIATGGSHPNTSHATKFTVQLPLASVMEQEVFYFL